MAKKLKETGLDQIAARQMRLWETRRLGEQERQTEEGKVEGTIEPFITLSREIGSGGKSIGNTVAERLSWEYFDRELVEHMAKVAQVRNNVVESLDETTMNGIQEWITTLINRDSFSHDHYLKHLMTVLMTIARHDRAVFVGRGASFVLPPERGLRVRIIAPLEMRVEEMQVVLGVGYQQAENDVLERDRQIQDFIKQHYRKDVTDPVHYDMVLNRAFLSTDSIVDQIVTAAQIRLKEL